MALSASISLAPSHRLSQFNLDCNLKKGLYSFLKPYTRKSRILKSVLNTSTSSSINDNGATEPARILLETLFAQTQEQIGRDPRSPHELGVDLLNLESDLKAAFSALKKKEQNLQNEYNEVSLVRKDLERREEEISAAGVQQEKLEEELRLANIELGLQAAEIRDLKLRVKKRDDKISDLQLSLSVKEGELVKMGRELRKKREKVTSVEMELRSKSKLLNEANKVVEKQTVELRRLEKVVKKKEGELEASIGLRVIESEKLKAAEANLKKQTMDWMVAREELKNLAKEANGATEEFGRVRKVFGDVRSELVSSQKALAFSRKEIEARDWMLERQLKEVEEQWNSIMSYMSNLRGAELEVESEKVKLGLAEARNEELGRELSMEKELVFELQKELDEERLSLEQAIEDKSALREEIDRKSETFEESQRLLKSKETGLVEARLEIEHLKSKQSSLLTLLEEKDLELSDAKKTLEEVNKEIAELKGVLLMKEDELIQVMSIMKEKDGQVQTMENEVDNATLKFSEAEEIVVKIVNLTKEVVNDAGYNSLQKNDRWQIKQLEDELNFTRERLRAKETEVLETKKDLIIKDEGLRMVLGKLEAREKELTEVREEKMRSTDNMKDLYALAQETIRDRSVGDVVIEKLQLEAARLEVEATTDALYKITEMSRELLDTVGSSVETDKCYTEVESEVSRLLSMTEQLVREAGFDFTEDLEI